MQARVFHVEKAVAEGGFGVVYRAQHDVFRSPIALKCLKLPEGLNEQQKAEFLERFRGEAELLFRLSAALPEVVRPLQFGVLDTRALVPYLALEWLEGETLDRFVARRTEEGKPPIGIAQALDILAPVARVLSRAHQFSDRGAEMAIIHRDVKPENVFLQTVDGERTTRILDFGIARVKQETNAIAGRATGVDALNAFSPAYAAPEQWSPETYGASGPWTDVYGLALTLTEILIGKPPIGGDLTSMMGAALSPDWRPTPRNKGVRVADQVERALEKALAVDPRKRTQSIEAFWSQLELSAGRKPSITRRAGSLLIDAAPMMDLELDIGGAPQTSAGPSPAPPAPHISSGPPRSITGPAGSSSNPPSGPPALAPGVLWSPPPTRAFAGLESSPPLSGALEVDTRSAPHSRPSGARPPVVSPFRPLPMGMPEGPSRSLGERFGGPAWLISLSLLIAGADVVATRMYDVHLALGPVRPLYIAGPLGVLGIVLVLVRLFEE